MGQLSSVVQVAMGVASLQAQEWPFHTKALPSIFFFNSKF